MHLKFIVADSFLKDKRHNILADYYTNRCLYGKE